MIASRHLIGISEALDRELELMGAIRSLNELGSCGERKTERVSEILMKKEQVGFW